MPNSGDIVKALDFPAATVSVQNTAGTTSSTSYTSTLTSGTACGVAFVAPTSGKVLVHNSALLDHSTTGTSWCSWILRTGASIGSGSTALGLSASDSRAIKHIGTSESRQGDTYLITGLTPGASYNIVQQFRTTGATATFSDKVLSVTPTT